MDIVPRFLLDQGGAPPQAGMPGPSDGELLDAYSEAVAGAVDRVGPAVAHIEGQLAENRRSGSGRGLVFTPHRLPPTNNHVVSKARGIPVTLVARPRRGAHPLGADPHTHVAVRRHR